MFPYFNAVSNALSQQWFCPRSLSSVYTEWLLRDCAKDITLTFRQQLTFYYLFYFFFLSPAYIRHDEGCYCTSTFPGSLFCPFLGRWREAEKRDPGNEVGYCKAFDRHVHFSYFWPIILEHFHATKRTSARSPQSGYVTADHEINKSWPNMKTKNPMRCLLENDSKVWLQPWHSFFVFPKSWSVVLFFYLKCQQKEKP